MTTSTGGTTYRLVRRIVVSAVSAAAAFALLLIGLPAATGADWSAVYQRFSGLPVGHLGLLAAVWLAGLFAHTYVMTGALPGLTHRRAMMLNFSGSAVSNLVPFGGALGMGLNYTMLRSWGFSATNFTVLTTLTNIWSVALKLLLPSLALGGLLLTGDLVSTRLVVAAAIGVGVGLVGLVAAVAVVLGSDRPAKPSRRDVATASRRARIAAGFREAMAAARDGIRRAWVRMTLGSVSYAALQALLLYLCFLAFGSRMSAVVVLAGYAMGRLLSLLPVTPAGVGLTETGSGAVLVALGADPAVATAAVLLYSTFTYLLEIPVGAAGTVVWWLGRERAAARPPVC